MAGNTKSANSCSQAGKLFACIRTRPQLRHYQTLAQKITHTVSATSDSNPESIQCNGCWNGYDDNNATSNTSLSSGCVFVLVCVFVCSSRPEVVQFKPVVVGRVDVVVDGRRLFHFNDDGIRIRTASEEEKTFDYFGSLKLSTARVSLNNKQRHATYSIQTLRFDVDAFPARANSTPTRCKTYGSCIMWVSLPDTNGWSSQSTIWTWAHHLIIITAHTQTWFCMPHEAFGLSGAFSATTAWTALRSAARNTCKNIDVLCVHVGQQPWAHPKRKRRFINHLNPRQSFVCWVIDQIANVPIRTYTTIL